MPIGDASRDGDSLVFTIGSQREISEYFSDLDEVQDFIKIRKYFVVTAEIYA